MTGFNNVRTEYFKQIPSTWNNNLIPNVLSELSRILIPDFILQNNKWLRFSREVMLLTYAEKSIK